MNVLIVWQHFVVHTNVIYPIIKEGGRGSINNGNIYYKKRECVCYGVSMKVGMGISLQREREREYFIKKRGDGNLEHPIHP